MKIISFSLWGSVFKYNNGAIFNAIEAQEIYPDWTCRFYCDKKVPQSTLDKLKELQSEIVQVDTVGSWDGLFWRFWAMDDSAEAVIIRDTDSVVNTREQAAVTEWLASPYILHGMRDHIEHNVPIMGGMWGCKKPEELFGGKLRKKIADWRTPQQVVKGTDQDFLKTFVWSKYREQMLVHDRFEGRVFKLPNGELVSPSELIYYNKFDNVDPDYPHGKIEFRDHGTFQRLDVYEYDAIAYFGEHKILSFPKHYRMKYGNYVGEIMI